MAYADAGMKGFLLTLLHVAVTIAKRCGPSGVRGAIAENLLLKQQLLVLRRGRQRAPNLTPSGRFIGAGGIALPRSETHPQDCRRPSAFDVAGVASGVSALQVPALVLVSAVPTEAWAERAKRGAHQGHRRTEVSQSPVRLSTDWPLRAAVALIRGAPERHHPSRVPRLRAVLESAGSEPHVGRIPGVLQRGTRARVVGGVGASSLRQW